MSRIRSRRGCKMNGNERSRGQDQQNQEQKGCRVKRNERIEGRMNQKGRVTGQDEQN
jgi:hypothetical protein